MSDYCGLCNGHLNGPPCHKHLIACENENTRLRAVLQEILDWAFVEPIGGQDLTDYKAKARAVLEGKTDVG